MTADLKPLGDFVVMSSGKSIKPGGKGRFPVYGSNGLIGGAESYLFESGCIVGRVGAYCGSVRLSLGPFWASDNTIVALPKDPQRTSIRYLYYALKSADLNRHAGGSAQPLLTQRDLRPVTLYHPPMRIQKKIAAVLSTYDDLIENNNRRIKILEEMAQRIYQDWFVDFRYPGHERVPLVDSELGLIPELWDVHPFAQLAKFVNGYAFKPGDWGNHGRPIIKIKELKNGVTSDTPRYSGDLGAKYEIQDGDLLFSWSADLDAYFWSGGHSWLNQHLFRVDPAEGFPRPFLFHALKDRMGEFRLRAQGTTMRHIKRSALDQVATVIPPIEIRLEFASLVSPLDDLSLRLVRATRLLRTTRDLLLPRLVSGEVDVSDLDIAIPEIAA